MFCHWYKQKTNKDCCYSLDVKSIVTLVIRSMIHTSWKIITSCVTCVQGTQHNQMTPSWNGHRWENRLDHFRYRTHWMHLAQTMTTKDHTRELRWWRRRNQLHWARINYYWMNSWIQSYPVLQTIKLNIWRCVQVPDQCNEWIKRSISSITLRIPNPFKLDGGLSFHNFLIEKFSEKTFSHSSN